MSDTFAVELAQRGVITLPKPLREAYDLKPSDQMTLLDLGGVFVLIPKRSEIDELADRISQALVDKGATLESMLHSLREQREKYGSSS